MSNRLQTVLLVGAVLVGVSATTRLITTNAAQQQSTSAAAAAPEIATVDRGDISLAITATGNINANQNVGLAFATSGMVTAINVKEGDYVRAGQTLAMLDNTTAQDAVTNAQLKVQAEQLALDTLNAKPRQVDIDVANANVTLAQAQLAEAKISPTDSTQVAIAQLGIQQAQNAVWQAQLQRDITNNAAAANNKNVTITSTDSSNRAIASANGSVSVAQSQLSAVQSQGANVGSIDSAQATLTSAQTQLATLLAGPNVDDVKQAQANLSAAQAALVQAQSDLSKTQLVAPFNGLVAAINLNLGQQSPATNAITLLDVTSFNVDLPVAEIDIAQIQVGMPVNLHFDALGNNSTVVGKVTLIADTPNSGTPVTYNVRVQIAPDGQPLLATMSTTASIIISDTVNVVRMPNRLIRIDAAHKAAYATVRQPDGTFTEVPIQLGASNDTYTEVKSGLKAGDVVTTPSAGGGTGRGPGGAGALLRGLGG
jgi:HlyD family secretion protein